MDDLIVIILTLIVAVIGAIGQIKKKKAAEQPVPENGQKTPSFWDLLDDEPDLPKPQAPKTEPVQPVAEELKVEEKPIFQFAKSTITSKSTEESSEKTIKQTVKETQSTKEKFSLRKAVVYSEILNRKYT